jgi:hypothetical protein
MTEIEVSPLTLKQRVLEAYERRTRARLAENRATLVALLLGAGIVSCEPPKERFSVRGEAVSFDLDGIRFSAYTERRYSRNDEQGLVALLRGERICAHEGCGRTALACPTAYEVKALADLEVLFGESLETRECYFQARHDTAPEGDDEIEELPF